MTLKTRLPYQEVWLYKFIFGREGPILPHPICLVGYELKSKRHVKIFQDELTSLTNPPFELGEQNLFVSYFIPNELHCHLVLGWPLPVNVIDLFPEFRCYTNGLVDPKKSNLSDALARFDLNQIDESLEANVKYLVLRCGPWSQNEKQLFVHYAESVVVAQAQLLDRMEDWVIKQLTTILRRSRYMVAITKMENSGIPIDTRRLDILKDKWNNVREVLILERNESFRVFEESPVKTERFEKYLESLNIPWPKDKMGRLDLREETFLQIGESYPQIQLLSALRRSLRKLNKLDLKVDSDGRIRCELRPFKTITGRNAPSSNKYIFNLPKWLRNLIKPKQGYGLAYLDWSFQEIGIAAALSKDSNLKKAYLSGDPYLAFAKKIGAIPQDATKESHRAIRNQFKEVVLAVQNGMSANSLALKIGKSEVESGELLGQYRKTYPTFWKWSDDVVNFYNTKGSLRSMFRWYLSLGSDEFNELSIRNFLLQANGSEMLHLACIMALDNHTKVIATVHDSILIEFPIEESQEHISICKEVMIEASRAVLEDFELDVDILYCLDGFKDPDGQDIWGLVWNIISQLDSHSSTTEANPRL